ncbi:MAG: TonB family protein [Myxococcota bacterium]
MSLLQPAKRRRKRNVAARAIVAGALAVLGHLAFAGLLIFLSLVHVSLPAPARTQAVAPPRAVTMRSVPADQWEKNRGQPAAPLPKKESRKEPEAVPKGQVVDVAPGNGEESAEAKYLAESSNRVDKETRAKEQTPFYRNAMPRRTSPNPQQGGGNATEREAKTAGNDGLGDDDRPLREGTPVLEIPDVEKRQEIALKTDPSATGVGPAVKNHAESDEVVGNSNRLRVHPGESGDTEASEGRKGSPGVANLIPSTAVLDKLTGAAANDHLGDVEEGEGTYLNTKEWKYSSFFNRVKQSVGMHWNPGQELRQRDPTGGIYGGRDRYTVLSVTLSERGLVKDIYVEKSCGVDFLDLEAIHSFERAQPFPNPPPGLVRNDSTVQFSFGFFLEMGGGPRMRLFRQAN